MNDPLALAAFFLAVLALNEILLANIRRRTRPASA